MQYSLDGAVFRSVSNTANGEVNAATVFHYHQSADVVTATYEGGAIVAGHLVAKVLANGQLDMRYHHLNDRGELMSGKCLSTPEYLPDGRLRFNEEWQWLTGDMSAGRSEIEEVKRLDTIVSRPIARDDVRTLVDYHYWARDRLLEACIPLTGDQFTRNLSSSFPSVRDTLVHLYTADWGWHLLWQGQPFTNPLVADRFPDLASISSVWQEQESKLRSFIGNLGTDRIEGFRQQLLHLVNHASYHRGQVTTMLRQLGVEAPESQDMIVFLKARA
jgi:uncharacterized damage-inducible protein DinB